MRMKSSLLTVANNIQSMSSKMIIAYPIGVIETTKGHCYLRHAKNWNKAKPLCGQVKKW